jgi:hypothetical protein
MRHHHALLQVASFHYATGGLEMAKEVSDGFGLRNVSFADHSST